MLGLILGVMILVAEILLITLYKVARSPAEIQELIQTGFEYVCEKDGLTFFRKRK